MSSTTPTPGPRAIFAYGTLRPGHGNHRWVLGDIPHHHDEGRLHGWALLGDTLPFPFAVPAPGFTTVGDVLTFDEADWPEALAATDMLEGYPRLYDRRVITVDLPWAPVEAWVYTPADPRRTRNMALVPGGDWNLNARIGAGR